MSLEERKITAAEDKGNAFGVLCEERLWGKNPVVRKKAGGTGEFVLALR